MRIRDILREIVKLSEKAACLARTVRAEHALFQLLVQEKTGAEKNKRFLQDFKTLADVLVQETVSHHLESQFPSLRGYIRGEESNKFTNVLGESVTVHVEDSMEDTALLLNKVLDGNHEAATLLAKVIHQDADMEVNFEQSELDIEIPDGSIGLWIDPIDSTAQYIYGLESLQHDSGVYNQGLQSVLVLIGVYDLATGVPILGVVNQPFTMKNPTSDSWMGSYWWGVCYGDVRLHSALQSSNTPPTPRNRQHLVMSSSEPVATCELLRPDYTMVTASGGGYKLLCVVEDLVAGFPLTRSSCFKWDTCAPHAILISLGGGVLDLQQALALIKKHRDLPDSELKAILVKDSQLRYNRPDDENSIPGQLWANTGGLLAYRDINTAMELLQRFIKL